MVLVIVKKAEESLFLYSTLAQTPISELLPILINLQNKRLKLGRLVEAVGDLCQHGILKPESEHGYSPLEINQLSTDKPIEKISSKTSDGKDVILHTDPTGRRTGIAPSAEMALIIERTLANATSVLSAAHITANQPLVEALLDEAFANISGALMIVYPEGLTEYEPAQEILDGTEHIQGAASKQVLANDATAWWANKSLAIGKVLSDYIGRNEKTKIIVKLQAAGSGAPVREAPLDPSAQKEMMAYYYRKQEEQKKLLDNDQDDYLNSPWADSRSLKTAFSGVNGVSWKPS